MPSEETQYKEGESGNPTGRPKGSMSLLGMIKKKLEDNPKMADRIIMAYLKEALVDGVNRRDLIDRWDGKPKQTINMTNEKDAEWLELFKGIDDKAKSETENDPDSIQEGTTEDIDS